MLLFSQQFILSGNRNRNRNENICLLNVAFSSINLKFILVLALFYLTIGKVQINTHKASKRFYLCQFLARKEQHNQAYLLFYFSLNDSQISSHFKMRFIF